MIQSSSAKYSDDTQVKIQGTIDEYYLHCIKYLGNLVVWLNEPLNVIAVVVLVFPKKQGNRNIKA